MALLRAAAGSRCQRLRLPSAFSSASALEIILADFDLVDDRLFVATRDGGLEVFVSLMRFAEDTEPDRLRRSSRRTSSRDCRRLLTLARILAEDSGSSSRSTGCNGRRRDDARLPGRAPGAGADGFRGDDARHIARCSAAAQPMDPARSTMQVAGLVDPGWLVEIEVTAATRATGGEGKRWPLTARTSLKRLGKVGGAGAAFGACRRSACSMPTPRASAAIVRAAGAVGTRQVGGDPGRGNRRAGLGL